MDVPINRYFLNHPEMVLGRWTSKDSLYGAGYGYQLGLGVVTIVTSASVTAAVANGR